MTKATTRKFSEFLVELGDGADPEQFSDPCGLTSRGFERTANMNETNVPDCTNPDDPSWLERDVVSYSASLSGQGVVAAESIDTWEDWWTAGTSKNVRVELGDKAWLGSFKLSQFNITGERGQRVNMSVTMVSDGPITAVA